VSEPPGRRQLLLAILLPDFVCAQEVTDGWKSLAGSALSTVYVLDDQRIETAGRLLHLNPDSLVLLTDSSERRFEAVSCGHGRSSARRLVIRQVRLQSAGSGGVRDHDEAGRAGRASCG
jgi:hypothetical protein